MCSTAVSPPARIIIGISGASGFGYGVAALRMLRALQVESHLVISPAAQLNRRHETALTEEAVMALADVTYDIGDVGAAIASGSFPAAGMLIAPCSMHTLAAVATGLGSNLLTRAADVTLKERRRLVLMVRETPLHAGHLRNMLQVTESGGIIFSSGPGLVSPPRRQRRDHRAQRGAGTRSAGPALSEPAPVGGNASSDNRRTSL